MREMDKRYLEHKVLPYLFSKELTDSSFHVSKVLKAKPYVTLLFPGTSRLVDDVRDEVDLEYDSQQLSLIRMIIQKYIHTSSSCNFQQSKPTENSFRIT